MADRFVGVNTGTLEEVMLQFEKKLREDEILMRLLAYPPQDGDTPPPLDDSLPDIVDVESDEYWEAVNRCVMSGEKTSDLENKAFCRIYIKEGRNRPIYGNSLIETQEIYIEIYVHEDFEKEKRLAMIKDRIGQLLTNSRVTGFGMVRFAFSNPQDAPQYFRSHYVAFEVNIPSSRNGGRRYNAGF